LESEGIIIIIVIITITIIIEAVYGGKLKINYSETH
jgi:hypothetical protein